VFANGFVNATQVPVELYETDGSVGAALGAGIGVSYFNNPGEAFANREILSVVEPTRSAQAEEVYDKWKEALKKQLT
jgi:xylulokinase